MPTDEPIVIPEHGWCTPARVTRVIDGDTFDCIVERTLRVRMLDYWAPESRTRDHEEKQLGLAAKGWLTAEIDGQPVTLFIPASVDGELQDVMTMGRVLARVYCQGRDVAADGRRAGHGTKEKVKA